jgi:hypothetical protein
MTRFTLFLVFFSLLLSSLTASGSEIAVSGPEARVANGEIVITTGVVLDSRSLDDLKNGISKEITFYVDLFRVWKVWPDEFIAGKKLVKTLWCDPIKKEYIATSFDGATHIEKRFKTFDSMLNWTLNLKDLKLINVRDLQPSDYFVKVTVVSRLRKLPPVIGYLLFFVPEQDFKVLKDSAVLTIGSEK